MKKEKRLLTRSSLRDVVIFCTLISSLFYPFHTTSVVVGFSLLLAGCVLHILAKGVLIRNVVLCNQGIYAIIRHPYYLANYLIDCSFCVLSGSPYLIMIYPFAFFWSYGPTLRSEEAVLASMHGSSFLIDSFEIPQVFPDRSSLKGWQRMLEGFSKKRITFKECARIARFCSVGFIIGFVHQVKTGPLTALNPLFHPTWNDYDEFLFMVMASASLAVSLAFLAMAHDRSAARCQCNRPRAEEARADLSIGT